jgi:hypothetical protein
VTRAVKAIFAVVAVAAVVLMAFRVVDNLTSDDDLRSPAEGRRGPVTVPVPPPETPTQGLYVHSHVTAEGQVQVETWLRSPTPVAELRLTTTDPDLLPGSVESLDLVVRTSQGRMLAHRDTVGTNPQTIRLREAVRELYFTYTVDGGMDDAAGTVEGRSLARVLAMDVDYDGAGGVVRRVVTSPGTVLNVACLRPSNDFQASPRPCGHATDGGGWTVDLRGPDRQDRLLAQLEV